jgi:N-carbamoyl-L-amino-acid hydrolase
MKSALEAAIATLSRDLGLTAVCQEIWWSPAIHFDEGAIAAVRNAAAALDYGHRDIVSGAGHDAAYVNRVAPTAMIFVPCADGLSHNEVESATPADLAAGCNVLLHAILEHAAPP